MAFQQVPGAVCQEEPSCWDHPLSLLSSEGSQSPFMAALGLQQISNVLQVLFQTIPSQGSIV